jgi:hypothetical protein
MKHIFVVTYGRSGSTLLMRVLNSIEGCDIKGENSNSLYWLYRSYKSVNDSKSYVTNEMDTSDHPWYGASSIDPKSYAKKLVNVFVNEILHPLPGTRITGFKEIRYIGLEKVELFSYLDFMYDMFEDSYFIFNTRNLDDVAKSAWWKRQPKEQVKAKLKKFENNIMEYHQMHPESSYIVHYDDYKGNPEYFRDLFTFLEEDFDFETVKSIMDQQLNHCKK